MSLPSSRPDPGIARLVQQCIDAPAPREILPPPDRAGWAISPQLASLLYRLVVEYRLTRVLEFGAGSSSVALATALAEIGGGRLTSVEQNPEWCAERWEVVRSRDRVDARLVIAQPRFATGPGGLFLSFPAAAPEIAERAPYDLVFIDAPQFFYGRDGTLHLAHPHLPAGTLIVLDDAGRSGERWSVRRWLRTYPGLELRLYEPDFGGKGVAVLQSTRPLRPRLDPVSVLSSAYSATQNWNKRRRRALRAPLHLPSPPRD